jgi:hypothetical protein
MGRAWSARVPFLAVVAPTIACASVLGLDHGIPLDANSDAGADSAAASVDGIATPGLNVDGAAASPVIDATTPVEGTRGDSAPVEAVVDSPVDSPIDPTDATDSSPATDAGVSCTQPASCNASRACCEGTYCWAGQSLGDDGTCESATCPAQFAPCVAVGDCCFGYVCQGNEQSGYFCQ